MPTRWSSRSFATWPVHGGSKLNVVPDACTVQVDRRLGLGETVRSAVEEIKSLAAAAADGTSASFETAPAGVWLEPFEMAASLPTMQRILRAVGQPQPAPPFVAATDAPHFVARGIPAVIFGPGALSVAHSAAESVEIAELAAAVDLYDRIARSVLAGPSHNVKDAGPPATGSASRPSDEVSAATSTALGRYEYR